jgi:hypothetical protein
MIIVMPVQQMTDLEFRRHALSILQRELGAKDFARFLRVYRSGQRDYTKERDHILKSGALDELTPRNRVSGSFTRLSFALESCCKCCEAVVRSVEPAMPAFLRLSCPEILRPYFSRLAEMIYWL